jgi:hypothetical protein
MPPNTDELDQRPGPHFNDKVQQISNRWTTATGRDQETGTA